MTASLAATALAGCTVGEDGPPAAGSPSPPSASALLKVIRGGGLAGPAAAVADIPSVGVYADGRVITPGPQILVYPPPALPAVQVQQIGAVRAQTLADRAIAAGVTPGTDFGDPRIADAPTTWITVTTAGTARTVAITGLQEAGADDPDLTPAQQAARRDVQDLLGELRNLPEDPTLPDPGPYRPDALAVLSRPRTASPEPTSSAPTGWASPGPATTQVWPGPALPGSAFSGGAWTGCVITTGGQTSAIRSAAQDASTRTQWTWQEQSWQVRIRPLLPDESRCADLLPPR